MNIDLKIWECPTLLNWGMIMAKQQGFSDKQLQSVQMGSFSTLPPSFPPL